MNRYMQSSEAQLYLYPSWNSSIHYVIFDILIDQKLYNLGPLKYLVQPYIFLFFLQSVCETSKEKCETSFSLLSLCFCVVILYVLVKLICDSMLQIHMSKKE
jgi:hypothetical protein